jgi:hypothetical protein
MARAVTETEAVRFVRAVNSKKSALPYPEIHEPHPPPAGSDAGFA